MKSKYIKYLLATGLITLATYSSCNKDVLNIDAPLVTEGAFFNTAAEFKTAVVGTYAGLSDYYGTSSGGNANVQVFFLPGDDLTVSNNDFELFSGISTSNGRLSSLFGRSYVTISRANKVLTKLSTVRDGILTTAEKNNMQGEMLFVRGFVHYMLWNIFGTAPILNKEITSLNEPGLSSTTGTQLLDQAIADFTAAAPLLPPSWPTTDVGRITANSAYGMLGKTLVFKGSITKVVSDFTAAIAAFDKIAGAELVPFGDNFDYLKENNKESIFEFQAGLHRKAEGEGNPWLANDETDIGSAGFYTTMFQGGCADYMGGGRYYATEKLKTALAPEDPRRALTLSEDGTRIQKYLFSNKTEGGCDALSYNNYRILRYADVLLLKAEAIVKSGGSPAAAIGLINQVRSRARAITGSAFPADLNAAETNTTTIKQWIRDERFVELAAEGQRWFDIKRWQQEGEITLDNAFFSSRNATQIDFKAPKNLYFPIPTSETTRNPNITPNPNY